MNIRDKSEELDLNFYGSALLIILYCIALVIATAFVGSWLTPMLIGWRKAKKEGRSVQTLHLAIKSLHDDDIDDEDIPCLDKLKDDIMDDYANGNISE